MRKQISFDYVIDILLPMAFIGSGFISMLLCLFGLYDNHYARLIMYGILLVTLLLFFTKIFKLLKTNNDTTLSTCFIFSIIPICFFILSFFAVILWGGQHNIVKSAISNGFYLMLSWCAITIIYCEKRVDFLENIKFYNYCITPAFIYYIYRFYCIKEVRFYVISWGSLSYMSIATISLLFLIATIASFYTAEEKLTKRQYILKLLFVSLCSVVISYTDCKGIQICGIFTALMYGILGVKIKKRNSTKMLVFSFMIVFFIVIFTFLIPLAAGESSRTLYFADEMISNKEKEGVNDKIDKQIQKNKNFSLDYLLNYVNSGQIDIDLKEGKIDKDEYRDFMDLYYNIQKDSMGPRKLLLACAISDIKKSPLLGNGVMYYQHKWNTYPHNIILEMCTDYGVPAGVLLTIVGVLAIIYSIKNVSHSSLFFIYVIYVLALLPRAMISGNLYDHLTFTQYGFLILFIIIIYRTKQQ